MILTLHECFYLFTYIFVGSVNSAPSINENNKGIYKLYVYLILAVQKPFICCIRYQQLSNADQNIAQNRTTFFPMSVTTILKANSIHNFLV